jgi:transcriptional regulator GlxA family with amidase domain
VCRTEPLLATGALDEKSFDELWTALETSVGDEPLLGTLVARYRQLVADIEIAVRHPTRTRRTQGTERALSFMREHLAEPLTLGSVARVAGFAPHHFSRIFKHVQGTTFERHLQTLRLERARQMLVGTSLHVQTVSALSGFNNRVYFHRVFRDAFGMTPLSYRDARSR